MTVTKYYYFVYLKTTWSSGWTYCPNVEPISCYRAVAPQVSTAKLRYRYGSGQWESGQAMTDGEQINIDVAKYCKITIADNTYRDNEKTIFIGEIPASQIDLLGYENNVKTADQILSAVGLEYLLETRLEKSWVIPVGGGTVTQIERLPAFNWRSVNGGILGNRSEDKNTFEVVGDDSFSTYVFAVDDTDLDDSPAWTCRDVIEYVVGHYQLPVGMGGPRFKLVMSQRVSESLDQLSGVYDLAGYTTRQALNVLVNRSRGFAWFVEYDNNTDNVSIFIVSMLTEDITVGDVTIPAHDPGDAVLLDLWNDELFATARIDVDDSQLFDKIIVRGANMKVCGTFRKSAGELVAAWTTAEQAEFLDAAKNVTGYGSLNNTEKAKLNDKYRATDKFSKVFTTYRVPRSWEWTLNSEKATPKWNPYTGLLETDTNAGYWNADKRFLPMIPFRDGFDYSGSSPTDDNPDQTEAEFRRPFAVAQDSDSKYVYLDKLITTPAMVRVLQTEPGVEIKFRPQYLFAGTSWSGEVGLWTADLSEYGMSDANLQLTAMLETDQPFQLFHIIKQTEKMRTKVIDLPAAELWYIVPGTVVDINDAGSLVSYGGTGEIRNDIDQLKAIISAAAAWYGRRRQKVSVKCDNIQWMIRIGQLLKHVDISDQYGDETGSVVTGISYNFQQPKPSMSIITDHAELDFAGIYSGAVSSSRQASPTIPSMSVAAKMVKKNTATVEQVKREVNKNPLRIDPPGIGNKRAMVHVAYCKDDAGSGSTITCYLDVDSTGEEITVNCHICGGSALNAAVPRLADGDEMLVSLMDGNWYCLTVFQTTEDCDCYEAP